MEVMSAIRIFLETFIRFPVNMLFWLVVFLVAVQYRRMTLKEKEFFGRFRHSFWQQTFISAGYGLAGGLLASVLLVFLGISLPEIGILYVWPLALLLLFVHPRYLCFAYAGGLVGAVAAVLQIAGHVWPALTYGPLLAGLAAIHIPGLLALIGILHLTESFLIAATGHLFPSPIFLKTPKGVIGGFSLQKFWPLPLVGLWAMAVPETVTELSVAARMPDWWPILSSMTPLQVGQTLIYVLFPIVAGLGYGDVAVSKTPRKKSKLSAKNLALYSIILIGAALLAFRVPIIAFPAALFAPFGHEFLIISANKKEFAAEPIYVPPLEGVRVMDIFPNSPAAVTSLTPGDVILTVNDSLVQNHPHFYYLTQLYGSYLTLDVEQNGRLRRIQLKNSREGTGIILVPDAYVPGLVEVRQMNFFTALSEKMRKTFKI